MSETEETLYEHAGGDGGLHRLEAIFYTKALADPVLKHVFTKRIPTHVEHLTWFTAESFVGPDRNLDLVMSPTAPGPHVDPASAPDHASAASNGGT